MSNREKRRRELWKKAEEEYLQRGFISKKTMEELWYDGVQMDRNEIIKGILIFIGLVILYAGCFVFAWLYGSSVR